MKKPIQNPLIVDYREAKELGIIEEGSEGDCFGEYEEENNSCRNICLHSDDCARYAFEKFNNAIAKIAAKALDKTNKAKPRAKNAPPELPEVFQLLDKNLRNLKYISLGAQSRKRSYIYKANTTLATFIPPFSEDSLIIRLYQCTKDELDDPLELLWANDPKYPGIPFLLIKPENCDYAYSIIKQVYDKLEKPKLFNEEKYVNQRRSTRKKSKKSI